MELNGVVTTVELLHHYLYKWMNAYTRAIAGGKKQEPNQWDVDLSLGKIVKNNSTGLSFNETRTKRIYAWYYLINIVKKGGTQLKYSMYTRHNTEQIALNQKRRE